MSTYKEAIARAVAEALDTYPHTFVLGQDVGRFSILGVTRGLAERHGAERVRDCPIAESAMVGMAVGAAMNGAVGIIEFAYADISAVAFSSVVHSAAKLHYATNGQLRCPMLIRSPIGRWSRHGPMGTEVTASWYSNVPGIVVAMPADATEAYWQARAAFERDVPTMFLEDKALYAQPGEIGTLQDVHRARVVRPGTHLTVVAAGRCVSVALQAAADLAGRGIEAEVISLGHVKPLDVPTVAASASRTGRLLVLQDEPGHGGYGPDVIARVAQLADVRLARPPVLLARQDEHLPYLREEDHLPRAADVADRSAALAR